MELVPERTIEIGAMTPKLEKLIHILDWVRIEEITGISGYVPGRKGRVGECFCRQGRFRHRVDYGAH
jgi:hypothetical protein